MFCPNCGKADQMPDAYCRQCGTFLPDLARVMKREVSAEEHLKANAILNAMTVFVSFTLAFLLYLVLGFKPETHPLIYAAGGFLFAIGCWQVQTLIRTQMLKKQWKRRFAPRPDDATLPEAQQNLRSTSTAKLLDQANLENAVPASVTEHTTRHLAETARPKS
jgi:hypothetical protein